MKTEETVSGKIIGGEYVTGRLFYAGKPESQRFFCDTESELIAKCNVRLDEIKEESHSVFNLIYPESGGWEIRIDL